MLSQARFTHPCYLLWPQHGRVATHTGREEEAHFHGYSVDVLGIASGQVAEAGNIEKKRSPETGLGVDFF